MDRERKKDSNLGGVSAARHHSSGACTLALSSNLESVVADVLDRLRHAVQVRVRVCRRRRRRGPSLTFAHDFKDGMTLERSMQVRDKWRQ
jgi:hypothetical protein